MPKARKDEPFPKPPANEASPAEIQAGETKFIEQCLRCHTLGPNRPGRRSTQPVAGPCCFRSLHAWDRFSRCLCWPSQPPTPSESQITVIVELEVGAGANVGRHTHPGIESTYVVEGEAELLVDGQPTRILKPGEAFQVPPGTVHGVRIGDKKVKACSTLVVEKGKPLVSPA